ncbi:MAG: hypothetical protein AAF471_00680 [Myxococcota bacterium]
MGDNREYANLRPRCELVGNTTKEEIVKVDKHLLWSGATALLLGAACLVGACGRSPYTNDPAESPEVQQLAWNGKKDINTLGEFKEFVRECHKKGSNKDSCEKDIYKDRLLRSNLYKPCKLDKKIIREKQRDRVYENNREYLSGEKNGPGNREGTCLVSCENINVKRLCRLLWYCSWYNHRVLRKCQRNDRAYLDPNSLYYDGSMMWDVVK